MDLSISFCSYSFLGLLQMRSPKLTVARYEVTARKPLIFQYHKIFLIWKRSRYIIYVCILLHLKCSHQVIYFVIREEVDWQLRAILSETVQSEENNNAKYNTPNPSGYKGTSSFSFVCSNGNMWFLQKIMRNQKYLESLSNLFQEFFCKLQKFGHGNFEG